MGHSKGSSRYPSTKYFSVSKIIDTLQSEGTTVTPFNQNQDDNASSSSSNDNLADIQSKGSDENSDTI